MISKYYIGWDVGGWNCEKNARSRDALVILNPQRQLVGTPWRGNLRQTINAATDDRDWLQRLFRLCEAPIGPQEPCNTVLSIDAALGFPDPLVRLLNGLPAEGPKNSGTNPYLFRQTEQFLFSQGLKPLSAIKDMIGSQATKALHVLARFVNQHEACGVWTNTNGLTAIEAYPSACAPSRLMRELLAQYAVPESPEVPTPQYGPEFGHQDKVDALICALTAWLFDRVPEKLIQPDGTISKSEGWIFVPADGLNR